mmetsp:Transcript_27909/g.85218  ORF Transcript_27909/g.85218 Transcript_27909/m.85218 type:complete len:212 (-) Transcript_27909:764-1399(-)
MRCISRTEGDRLKRASKSARCSGETMMTMRPMSTSTACSTRTNSAGFKMPSASTIGKRAGGVVCEAGNEAAEKEAAGMIACVTGFAAPICRGIADIPSSFSTTAIAASMSSRDLHSSCAQPSPCEPTPFAPQINLRSGAYSSTRCRFGAVSCDGQTGMAYLSKSIWASSMSSPNFCMLPWSRAFMASFIMRVFIGPRSSCTPASASSSGIG